MGNQSSSLPEIPSKRYFTIGEASVLCGVKSHVLRYWEQEFAELKPMKRRGNRRYYQKHDIELVRRIRGLLYDDGFTIQGAKAKIAAEASGDSDIEAIPNEIHSMIAELEDILTTLNTEP